MGMIIKMGYYKTKGFKEGRKDAKSNREYERLEEEIGGHFSRCG
jgi:hypothetical protein